MENMELEQHFQESFSHHETVNEDQLSPQKKKPVSAPTTVFDNCNVSFDCNICLDYARDPVVTLCGHLYCWPCIYKWLHFQRTSTTLEQQQQCPVCKADISDTTLVPLYGRGQSSPEIESDSKGSSDLEIPHRPPAYGVHTLITSPNQQLHSSPYELQSEFEPDQNQQYYRPNYSAASPMFNLGGTTTHPMIWMFGEMFYARVFGNSTEVSLFEYPNSYHHLTGSSSPRVSRQEMKAEKSLNRISIFLFCCFVLCLLLF